MKKKLNCVLLVDDDPSTNFLHSKLIKSMDITEHIEFVRNGQEALDFLTNSGKYANTRNDFPQPQILILDINMPIMNGWEFLEEYAKLQESQKCEVIIMMLTTSYNLDDKAKAENIPYVSSFRNKPLTMEMVNELMEKYFSDYL